jgi:hypothetical protein
MAALDTFDNSLKNAASKLAQDAKELRYKNDPVLWAEEVLGIVLWSKQKEILNSLAMNKRTVKSSHSIGKTYLSAVASCWWTSTREQGMVQSTAPTYQQVHSLLWEEIRTMHTKNNLRGRITLKDQWYAPFIHEGRSKEDLVAEGKKPADSNIHGFQGTHRSDGVLAILDEACGVASSIFTGAEAITTARMDRQLAVGNPDDPNTEFGRVFTEASSEWSLITVSAFDTPHFTGEAELMKAWARAKDKDKALVKFVNKRDATAFSDPHMQKVMAILDHMPDPEWIESRRRDWGEDSPRFLSKVKAEFPKTSVDSLFSASEIETGRNNVIEPASADFRVMAVDVARFGTDRTVVILNVNGHCEILASINSMDTMEIAATVHKLATDPEIKADQIRVDGIGVGGGVVDRLTALSRAAEDPNARAYWYDSLKYQLRNGLIDIPTDIVVRDNHEDAVKLPPEGDRLNWAKQLLKEMSMIKYGYPNGIMQIESKEDMRRRGDKSPDYADALVMSAAPIDYITEDPLAGMRAGTMLEIDAIRQFEVISPF